MRRGRVDFVLVLKRHGPQQLAGVGVDAEPVGRRALGDQPPAAVAKQDRRGVRGDVVAQRGRGPYRLAGSLVERGHQGLAAAGRDDHPIAVDQQAFAQGPVDVLGVEPFEDVDGPDFAARVGFKADQAPVGAQVIEPAVGERAASPGPRETTPSRSGR